jgi:hypothetical protein
MQQTTEQQMQQQAPESAPESQRTPATARRDAPEAMTEAMVDAAAAAAPRAPEGRAAPADAPGDPVDWWTERLVDAGELEAAAGQVLADAAAGSAAAGALRRLSLAAARGLAAAHRASAARSPGEREWGDASLARAHARLAAAAHLAAVAVRDARLSGDVEVPVATGFADAGVYPETYAAAARELARRVGPARALVVGTGGTGAGLSAVVADLLARRGVAVRSVALDAADDLPNARRAAFDALLRDAAAAPGTWAAVVDDGLDTGPDAFARTAERLAAGGFDPARVVFFPSWSSDAAGAPGAAHRRFAARFDDVVLAHGAVRCQYADPDCRHVELGPPTPLGARLYRCDADHAGDGPVRLTFAGLGRYGRERAAAAARRAESGEGPRVFTLRRGYLVTADAPAPRTAAGRAD